MALPRFQRHVAGVEHDRDDSYRQNVRQEHGKRKRIRRVQRRHGKVDYARQHVGLWTQQWQAHVALLGPIHHSA